MLELAERFFRSHRSGRFEEPSFRWRIICEPDTRADSSDVLLSAFSDPGVAYVNIGQRGFLAVDLDKREAVAYLSEGILEGESRFRHRPPLDILFTMTAASMGVTALSGGCVGRDDRAVLILGPPNSGKTTTSYLAAKLAFDFHADQVVFLDWSGGNLCTWGDPFPAVFRSETLSFLPELKNSGNHSTYADLSFFYFDKSVLQPALARPVKPICSVFLDRRSGCKTQMARIDAEEAILRLRESLLFKQDERFDLQTTEALEALVLQPAYRLRYDTDPRIAAGVVGELLR